MVHSDLIVKNQSGFTVREKWVRGNGYDVKDYGRSLGEVSAGKTSVTHLTPHKGFLGVEKGVGAVYEFGVYDESGQEVGDFTTEVRVPACGDNTFEVKWGRRPPGVSAVTSHLGKGGEANAHRHQLELTTDGLERLAHNTADGNLRAFTNVPVVGFAIAAGHASQGSSKQAEDALAAQRDCLDHVPGVGHVKGAVHAICGDKEGAIRALVSATRSTAVIAAGAFSGGAGAVAMGAAWDGVETAIASAEAGEFSGAGTFGAVQKMANGESCWAEDMLAVAGLAGDAMTGAVGRRAATRIREKVGQSRTYRVMNPTEGIAAVQEGALKHAKGGPLAEKWVSESTQHSRQYGQSSWRPLEGSRVYQLTHDAAGYQRIAREAIPQAGSKQINLERVRAGETPLNVTNLERLADHAGAKKNLCLKGPERLQEFNQTIQKVKPIDPYDFKHRHGGLAKVPARFGAPVGTLMGAGFLEAFPAPHAWMPLEPEFPPVGRLMVSDFPESFGHGEWSSFAPPPRMPAGPWFS